MSIINPKSQTLDPSRIHCVVGGQFGSEAKGHVTAQIIARLLDEGERPINVRVGGPNAGHSAANYRNGTVVALRTIPIGAVVDEQVTLVIGQGSEIDPEVLYHEIDVLGALGIEVQHRLIIDQYATMLFGEHRETEQAEQLTERTGSTGKGIGACRADRIMRGATIARDYQFDARYKITVADTASMLNQTQQPIVIEGTQGYGLGLHTRFYPYTTSGDCRAIDICAQAGIMPTRQRPIHAWVVVRTYPIRVAGNSGPLSNEVDWDQLNQRNSSIAPEYTTVTKKMRRVGEWDADLVREAIAANGGTGDHLSVCLMFADYLDPALAGVQYWAQVDPVSMVPITELEYDIGQQCAMYGTSPTQVLWTR